MKIPLLLASILVFAANAGAQASDPRSLSIGVWRGTSLCLVRPSACHDEVVVYRLTPMASRDSVSFDAWKIVNGQEDEMGAFACGVAAAGTKLTCAMRNGAWHFTIRGDSLVGDLRLPDNTKFRDIRTARSH